MTNAQSSMGSVAEPVPDSGLLSVRRRWLLGALGLAVAAPVVWYVGTKPLVTPTTGGGTGALMGGPAKGVGPRVEYEAPNFTLKGPSGTPIELKQLRGNAVLINFWATWCAPCRDEMPEMEQIYREHKDNGLVVLAVSVDNDSSSRFIPDYLKEGAPTVGSYTFPVALDSKQEVMQTYRITGVPSSFFVDPAGVIRAVQPGAMSRQTMLERLRTVFPAAG